MRHRYNHWGCRWLAGVALLAVLAAPTPQAWGQHRRSLPPPAPAAPARPPQSGHHGPGGRPQPPPPAPPKPRPPHPGAMLETMPNAAIAITRLRRLPDNFHQVKSLSWSADGRRLLVDRLRGNTYEMAVIEVPREWDGRQRFKERVLYDVPMSMRYRQMPQHRGAARWVPGSDSQYVFVAPTGRGVSSTDSVPWNGWFCNVQLGDLRSERVIPLTTNNYSQHQPGGVASPMMSSDRRRLFWCGARARDAHNTMWGQRHMYLADVQWTPNHVRLTNVSEVRHPEGGSFCETYGFSRDGQSLLYTASHKGRPWFFMDLYGYDLQRHVLKNLTEDTSGWNRWASFSPRGHKILWSSSAGLLNPNMGVGGSRWQQELRSELWIMNADGSDKRRLTAFNRVDSLENRLLGMTTYQHCYVGESAWSPDGQRIAVVVHLSGPVPSSVVLMLDIGSR